MDPQFLASTVNKFLHLSAAGIVVGAVIYLRLILLPTLDRVEESQSAAVWQAAFKRTSRWILYSFLVLIITGIENVRSAQKSLSRYPEMSGSYWSAFGAKMGAVLLAFVLIHLLIIKVPAFRRIQESYRTWLTVMVVLVLVILYLSGYLNLTRFSLISFQHSAVIR